MEIIAVVKFNKGEAFVFDEIPNLVYTKYGNDTIIGKSGPFYTLQRAMPCCLSR